ncbi:MAG: GxxExxY protein [Ginsengibacter sp.]
MKWKKWFEFYPWMEMIIFMKGLISNKKDDFFVKELVIVELKAIIKLEEVKLTQTMNYCQAYNLPIG